jgi:hypothetical protein
MICTKTQEEIIADFLAGLVRAMADDMLEGKNSGIENIYTDYVSDINLLNQTTEEASF